MILKNKIIFVIGFSFVFATISANDIENKWQQEHKKLSDDYYTNCDLSLFAGSILLPIQLFAPYTAWHRIVAFASSTVNFEVARRCWHQGDYYARLAKHTQNNCLWRMASIAGGVAVGMLFLKTLESTNK